MAVAQVSFTWGVEVYQAIAMYGFIIVLSGILLGQAGAGVIVILIISFLSLVYYGHQNNLIPVDTDWKQKPFGISDLIVLNSTFAVTALVSWLSSREITKSLKRAISSEKEARSLAENLKNQRDNLEALVEERTKDLRQAQFEKMQQMYSTVELGRVAAGLLHDVNNPLTVIALNLDTIQRHTQMLSKQDKIPDLSQSVESALLASKKVEAIVKASKNQVLDKKRTNTFKIIEEIRQISLLFEYRIKNNNIKLLIQGDESITIHSYEPQFAQVIANLLANAIDSFTKQKLKKITVSVRNLDKHIEIVVEDNGRGIKQRHLSKLFEPLFTTKVKDGGTGLGLFMSHKIVNEILLGEISVRSIYKKGSVFTVILPKKINCNEKKSTGPRRPSRG